MANDTPPTGIIETVAAGDLTAAHLGRAVAVPTEDRTVHGWLDTAALAEVGRVALHLSHRYTDRVDVVHVDADTQVHVVTETAAERAARLADNPTELPEETTP